LTVAQWYIYTKAEQVEKCINLDRPNGPNEVITGIVFGGAVAVRSKVLKLCSVAADLQKVSVIQHGLGIDQPRAMITQRMRNSIML
jgi:hypothetical protein